MLRSRLVGAIGGSLVCSVTIEDHSMRSFTTFVVLMAVAGPVTAATFNSRIAFMEDVYIDTKTYTYTGSNWHDPSAPEPYYVENDIDVTGFEFDFRMKNGRGSVSVSINGYEDSDFNIRSVTGEPFAGFFNYFEPDIIIRSDQYDPEFLGMGWSVFWEDFNFVATPRGKTEIYPYGFIFFGDLGDWGDNYDEPRYQRSYYFADVTPLVGPVSVPNPASLPSALAGMAAMGLLRMRRRNPLD